MQMSTEAVPSDGRRKSEVPQTGQDKAPGAVATAFAELSDRHILVDNTLEGLAMTVDRLVAALSPVLPDVGAGPAQTAPDGPVTPERIDIRGRVARSISAEARTAARQAELVGMMNDRLIDVLDSLEV